MRVPGGFILVLLMAALAAPLAALGDVGTDPQEANRHHLEKIKQDPEKYARLCENLQTFLALPRERQDALRLLDRGLHDEPRETTLRLSRALDRYSWWYEHLGKDDRKRIEAADDSVARLQVIRRIREAQWVDRLPKRQRDELSHLKGEARDRRIAELRSEERKRRQQWQQRFAQWQQNAQQQWQRSFHRWYQGRKRSDPEPSPETMERILLRLAIRELAAEDRARLQLSAADLTSWDRLKDEFIRRHPDEWRTLVKKEQANEPKR